MGRRRRILLSFLSLKKKEEVVPFPSLSPRKEEEDAHSLPFPSEGGGKGGGSLPSFSLRKDEEEIPSLPFPQEGSYWNSPQKEILW